MSFAARYRSDCVECDEPIRAGDIVEYDELDYVRHTQCPNLSPSRYDPCLTCYCDPWWCL